VIVAAVNEVPPPGAFVSSRGVNGGPGDVPAGPVEALPAGSELAASPEMEPGGSSGQEPEGSSGQAAAGADGEARRPEGGLANDVDGVPPGPEAKDLREVEQVRADDGGGQTAGHP
jgi:hypothetical protein